MYLEPLSQRDMRLMAATLHLEAANQPDAGILAVAQVILNRAVNPRGLWQAETALGAGPIERTVLARLPGSRHGQFSCWNGDRAALMRRFAPPRVTPFTDQTSGAVSFTAISTPGWMVHSPQRRSSPNQETTRLTLSRFSEDTRSRKSSLPVRTKSATASSALRKASASRWPMASPGSTALAA